MADIKSPVPDSPSKLAQFPDEHSRLLSGLFASEKSLIKLKEGLPVEKQETFIRQIQVLSKKRLSLIASLEGKDPCKDTIIAIAALNDDYNECLQSMISEIVEEHENLEYNETETASKLLRRRSTKGMIIGNFNEVLESMEKILSIGENLIIQGYQKLFIDSNSMKGKLQSVIDERRNLPVGSRPIETLVVKQNFLEKQLNCLVTLFEEANTLTDLITKLQDFDKRQIQFQKTSQVTVDAFKKFFYKPDVRKTNERRRTYLSVNYANPDTTREGLDILRDQVNSIVRNINVVCDMEDAKVRTINKSDLGDRCDTLFEDTKEMLAEEKEILTETFEILSKFEESSEVFEKYEQTLESLYTFGDKPGTQLEIIKLFVEKGMQDVKKRLELAKVIKEFVEKYEENTEKNSASVERLKAENASLLKDNNTLRSQVQSKVVEKISEGTHSLKELFDYQEHLKRTIQETIETGLKEKVLEIIMLNSGTAEILLGVNPDEDIRVRISEYESDYSKADTLVDSLELLSRYQSLTFRLACKLGMVSEGHIHANIASLRNARSLKEARECIVGKPNEYPLTKMDRTLSEIIRCYLAGLEDNKGSIESVVRKQNVIGRLLRDFKG